MLKNTAKSLKSTITVIPKSRKNKIPAALREQVWIHNCGRNFQMKCPVHWCKNYITVFDFQCGHKHAEAQGGPTVLENLVPLCQRCNQSMGTMHFDEWSRFGMNPKTATNHTLWQKLCSWFRKI